MTIGWMLLGGGVGLAVPLFVNGMQFDYGILWLLFGLEIFLVMVSWVRTRDVFNPLFFSMVFWLYLYGVQPLLEVAFSQGGREAMGAPDARAVMGFSVLAAAAMYVGYGSRVLEGPARVLFSRLKLYPSRWEPAKTGLFLLGFFMLLTLYRVHAWKAGTFFHIPSQASSEELSAQRVLGYVLSSGAPGNALVFLVAFMIAVRTGVFRRSSKLVRVLLWAVVGEEFVVSVLMGWRSFLPIVVISAMLIRHRTGARTPWRRAAFLLAVTFATLVPLREIGFLYRVHTEMLRGEEVGAALEVMKGAALEFLRLASDPLERVGVLDSSAFVLDAHRNLAKMLRVYSDRGDYQFGKTIILPLLRYPLKILGASEESIRETNVHNVMARQLGLVDPYVYQVNVTVPIHGELYMNFGVAGMLLGMLILGAIYRAMEGVAKLVRSDPERANSGILVYFMLWYYWVFLGTYFSIGTLVLITLAKLVMWGPVLLLIRRH